MAAGSSPVTSTSGPMPPTSPWTSRGIAGVQGNMTPVAEANIIGDPEAAAEICAAAWPTTFVGLDVTQKPGSPAFPPGAWDNHPSRAICVLVDAEGLA